jgi:hypothetical protein
MPSSRGKGILLGVPDRGKGASSRPGAGRICDFPGCATVLTTFNASSTCWLHSDPSFKRWEPSRAARRVNS